MTQPTHTASTVRAFSRALHVLACSLLLCACDEQAPGDGAEPRDAGSEDAGDSATPTRVECTTTCGTSCGGDDGCGGSCECGPDARCDNGVCVPSECGSCAEGEQCVGGACVCAPECTDRYCEPDGCGGTCECPDGYVQNANGKWVPKEECFDTCAGAGWTCGALCGVDCGACTGHDSCTLGRCECLPVCDGSRCDDGCGALCECAAGTVCDAAGDCKDPADCHDTCGSASRLCGEVCGQGCGSCDASQSCVQGRCQEAINCADCALRFFVVERRVVDGRIKQVTLAVDYQPTELEPRPRLADLRVVADRPVSLTSATAGPALTTVGKQLFVDESTGKPWKVRDDGTLQFLAYRATNTESFATGRMLTLTFTLDQLGPVRFALQRRLQTFAPPEADSALQASTFETEVVVSR